LALSASHGLRFGVNRLRVRAYRSDGRFTLVARRIIVGRGRPLAGAGIDRRVFVRRTVRLDGRASRASRRGHRLAYRWRLIRRPRSSHAVLRGARSRRPRLRLDRPGRFRARLTVRESGRRRASAAAASSDEVGLTGIPDAPPPGIPASVAGGFSNAVTLSSVQNRAGQTVYSGFSADWELGSYSVVAIDRFTLRTLDSSQFALGQEAALTSKILGYKSQGYNAIVFLRATPAASTQRMQALEGGLAAIGATPPPPEADGGSPAFSVVGILGSKPGQAYQRVGDAPEMDGVVTREAASSELGSNGYTFAPVDYIPFDLDTASGSLTVGCTPRTPATCVRAGADGDLNLFVLDAFAGTLVSAEGYDVGSSTQLAQLVTDLAGVADDPSKLVIFATRGQPTPSGVQPIWSQIANQLRTLGGNLHTFNTLNFPNGQPSKTPPTQDYALASGAGMDPQEEVGGSDVGGNQTTLEFTGVLTRNSDWQLSPVVSAPLGVFDMTLSQIAYQPPQAWPYSGGDYTAMEQYIARNIRPTSTCINISTPTCGPGVREAYWQLFPSTEWTTAKTDLTSLGPPPGATSAQVVAFQQLKTQFLTGPSGNNGEFDLVNDATNLIMGAYEPFATSINGQLVSVSQISQDIQKKLPPTGNSTSQILATIGDIMSAAAAAAGFIPASAHRPDRDVVGRPSGALPRAGEDPIGPQVGGGLGIVANAFAIASVWTQDPDGNKLLQEVQDKAIELENDLSTAVKQAQIGLERLGELIVSDPGKLSAADALYGLVEEWSLDGDALPAASSNLEVATRQMIWNGLLPPALAGVGCYVTGEPAINVVADYPPFGSPNIVELRYLNGNLSSLVPLVFAQPTFDVGDINAAEVPQRFWLEVAKPANCKVPLTRDD